MICQDEADILADKIAILAKGRLRCVGSSLFLKKRYGVGYHLAIEKATFSADTVSAATKDFNHDDHALKEIVTKAVKEAKLLTNVGKEMSFQLPLESNSRFGTMLRELDSARNRGAICSYGLNMTTLEEVFQRVTSGDMNNAIPDSSPDTPRDSPNENLLDDHFTVDPTKRHGESLVCQHLSALLRKRMVSFKRDKKAWCFTTLLPGIFVLIGFLALKYASPSKNLEPLSLDLEAYNLDADPGGASKARHPIPYNSPDSSFKCQPGWCSYEYPINQVQETNELYFFCGAQSYLLSSPNCSIEMSRAIVGRISDAGAVPIGQSVRNINEVGSEAGFLVQYRCLHQNYISQKSFQLQSSHSALESSNFYGTSQYGAIYFTHEPNSTTLRGTSYGQQASNQCYNYSGHYMRPEECSLYAGIGYVIGYNFTALHAAVRPTWQRKKCFLPFSSHTVLRFHPFTVPPNSRSTRNWQMKPFYVKHSMTTGFVSRRLSILSRKQTRRVAIAKKMMFSTCGSWWFCKFSMISGCSPSPNVYSRDASSN